MTSFLISILPSLLLALKLSYSQTTTAPMRPMATKAYFKHAPIVQEVEQELYEDVDILVMKGRPSMKRLCM